MTKSAAAGQPAKSAVQEGFEIVKTVFWALLIALIIRTVLFQPYTIPSASEEPNLYQGDYIIVSKWSYGYSRHSILFSPPLFSGRLLFSPPRRGDTVVFKLPRDGHTDYIKRLIGLPGDTLQVRKGVVFINGKALPQQPVAAVVTIDRGGPERAVLVRETNPEGRSYIIQSHGGDEAADTTGLYVIPPHCYFMMGDNREDSADSRFDPGLPPEDAKLGGCGWDSRNDAALAGETGVGFVPEDNLVGKAQIVLLSWKPNASLFKPWTWIDLRLNRFLRLIR